VLESALHIASEKDLKQDLGRLLTQVQTAEAASEIKGS
jgi:hypothetical protein